MKNHCHHSTTRQIKNKKRVLRLRFIAHFRSHFNFSFVVDLNVRHDFVWFPFIIICPHSTTQFINSRIQCVWMLSRAQKMIWIEFAKNKFEVFFSNCWDFSREINMTRGEGTNNSNLYKKKSTHLQYQLLSFYVCDPFFTSEREREEEWMIIDINLRVGGDNFHAAFFAFFTFIIKKVIHFIPFPC